MSAPTSSSIALGGTNTDGVTVTGTRKRRPDGQRAVLRVRADDDGHSSCTSTAHAVGSAVSLTLGSGTSTATSPAFTPTAAGYWCFSGVYSGDSNYETSTDATVDECFHVTAASSSSVTAPGASSVVFGTNDGDTLTVTGNAAGGSPTGNVQFYVCGPTSVPTACTSTSDPISLARSMPRLPIQPRPSRRSSRPHRRGTGASAPTTWAARTTRPAPTTPPTSASSRPWPRRRSPAPRPTPPSTSGSRIPTWPSCTAGTASVAARVRHGLVLRVRTDHDGSGLHVDRPPGG